MVQLHIDLQEGFTGNSIIMKVNGDEVFNKKDVQTKLLLGYADTFEVKTPEGMVDIEIEVADRNLTRTITLQVSKTTYLGLSLQASHIEYIVSDKPFGYQ